MRVALRPTWSEARPTASGSAMHLLVLCPSRNLTYGVDLASGAFLRIHHPAPIELAKAPRQYDVATTRVADDGSLVLSSPEDLVASNSPRTVGHMRPRQVERILSLLHHPEGQPLFGGEGPSVPLWSLDNRPSVSLVQPNSDLAVRATEQGLMAQFRWRGYTYSLPVEDRRLLSRMDWFPENPVQGRALAEVLGFFPSRLLLSLSEPVNGYCYKQAVGLLR
jgi:hypothetical protein